MFSFRDLVALEAAQRFSWRACGTWSSGASDAELAAWPCRPAAA